MRAEINLSKHEPAEIKVRKAYDRFDGSVVCIDADGLLELHIYGDNHAALAEMLAAALRAACGRGGEAKAG